MGLTVPFPGTPGHASSGIVPKIMQKRALPEDGAYDADPEAP